MVKIGKEKNISPVPWWPCFAIDWNNLKILYTQGTLLPNYVKIRASTFDQEISFLYT